MSKSIPVSCYKKKETELGRSGGPRRVPASLDRVRGQRMSLQAKVAALRAFFGLDSPLFEAIEKMNHVMELASAGPLPEQVDKLVSATGVVLASTTPVVLPAQVSPAAAQTPPPSATAASAASLPGSKRKLEKSSPTADLPDQKKGRQMNLFEALPDAPKTSILASELKAQRELAAQGKDYSPRQHDGTFDSEKPSSDVVKPLATYQCLFCPKTFNTPGSLSSHAKWTHGPDTKPKIFAPPPPPPPPPRIELSWHVSAEGRVRLRLAKIGGVATEQIEAERVAAAEQAATRTNQLGAEAKRRERKREAEDQVESGEHRGGSGSRNSYNPKQKLAAVAVRDDIYLNPLITNKGQAWADKAINPKFYGIPFGNLHRWSQPEDRRRLAVAAAQAHAGTLLRIDKESRKKGKYATMEKELFDRFKARRARARKASPRWLTHMAR